MSSHFLYTPSYMSHRILTRCFYYVRNREGKKFGFPLCYVSDIADFEEYKATGLFEYKGVAGHPGDKGTCEIADRIIKTLDKII